MVNCLSVTKINMTILSDSIPTFINCASLSVKTEPNFRVFLGGFFAMGKILPEEGKDIVPFFHFALIIGAGRQAKEWSACCQHGGNGEGGIRFRLQVWSVAPICYFHRLHKKLSRSKTRKLAMGVDAKYYRQAHRPKPKSGNRSRR